MKIKDYMIVSLISIVVGFIIIYGINIDSNRMIRYQTIKETEEQIKFLKDSLETQYYKKQLESYPYEHSKIPKYDATK
jgi:hypothetical protein